MIGVHLELETRPDGSWISEFEVYRAPLDAGKRTESDFLVRRACGVAGRNLPANSADAKLDIIKPYPVRQGRPSGATVERMVATTLIANANIDELTASSRWSDVRIRRERFGGFLFVPLTSALIELPESEFDHIERSVTARDPRLISQIDTYPVDRLLYELYVARALNLLLDHQLSDV